MGSTGSGSSARIRSRMSSLQITCTKVDAASGLRVAAAVAATPPGNTCFPTRPTPSPHAVRQDKASRRGCGGQAPRAQQTWPGGEGREGSTGRMRCAWRQARAAPRLASPPLAAPSTGEQAGGSAAPKYWRRRQQGCRGAPCHAMRRQPRPPARSALALAAVAVAVARACRSRPPHTAHDTVQHKTRRNADARAALTRAPLELPCPSAARTRCRAAPLPGRLYGLGLWV